MNSQKILGAEEAKNLDLNSDTEQLKKESGLKTRADELEELRIKTLLEKEKPVFKSLGMGLHNGVFYFGTKIYDEKGDAYDTVVTSDKTTYVNWNSNNQIKNKFGLVYKWPFFDGILDMQWSNAGIKKWLYDSSVNIAINEIFNKVLEKNKFFMDYQDERWHKFVALDIISSYFTEIFECKGRTIFSQEHGSGKSRQCELYKMLAFNSAMSIDWTESAIFRSIESTKSTIIIDNFDEIPEELRKSMMSVFRAYRKSKTVRTEGEKKRQPLGFDLFTSMILNNILGLDEVSEDRARKPKLLKSKNMEIVNKKINQKSPEWQELRDDFYICALQNWKIVLETYEKMKEERLIGRELEVYEDILVLARVINNELYEEMLNLILSEIEQKKIRELSRDYLYLGMKAVLETLEREKTTEEWIRITDIADEVARTLWDSEGKDFEKKKRGVTIYLGKVLKNNPLFKGRMYNGTSQYYFKLEKVLINCDLKDFKDLISTYSTLSTNPTLSTYSTTSHITPRPVEKVEEVE